MPVTESIARVRQSFSTVLEKSKFTKGIRALDEMLMGLGTKLETQLESAGSRWKYMTEIMLKIPLLLMLHQLLLLSPTSDYRLIELLMFIIRYTGKNIIYVCFIVPFIYNKFSFTSLAHSLVKNCLVDFLIIGLLPRQQACIRVI